MVCDLRPGDALLVPGGWWVHTQLLQPNTCALTLQLHPGPERVATKGSLLLQLSRCIEAWTAGTVGVANTRNQLMVSSSFSPPAVRLKLSVLLLYATGGLAACHAVACSLAAHHSDHTAPHCCNHMAMLSLFNGGCSKPCPWRQWQQSLS
jgi:hypothetical protein